MNHGSINFFLRWSNSQNNGMERENRIQIKRRQFHLLERSWHQFLGPTWDNFHWLSSKRKNNQRRVLCEIILKPLTDEIKKKRPHLAKKKVLFRQDNAPVHTYIIAMATVNKFKSLARAPYSPDLAPPYCFLFQSLEKWLDVQRFSKNEEVPTAREV